MFYFGKGLIQDLQIHKAVYPIIELENLLIFYHASENYRNLILLKGILKFEI